MLTLALAYLYNSFESCEDIALVVIDLKKKKPFTLLAAVTIIVIVFLMYYYLQYLW